MPKSTDSAALNTLLAAARSAPTTSAAIKRLAQDLAGLENVSAAIDHALEFSSPETAARLMMAAAEAGRPPTAEQVGRVLPRIRDIEHMPILVGCASGDQVGMLIELLAQDMWDWDREGMAALLALELTEGSPPPELIAQLRRICRRGDTRGPSLLLGLALKAAGDADLTGSAQESVDLANIPGLDEVTRGLRSMMADSPLEALPSHAPARVVSGFTARRAVPKVGRNDPCPCGSGKKYKRCCLRRDAARLSNPSPVAGLTMDEYLEQAGAEMDPSIFRTLQPWDLKRLNLSSLPTNQLKSALDRFALSHHWAEAEQVMDLVADRSDVPGAADEDRLVFIMQALEAGAMEVVRRQVDALHDPTILLASMALALELDEDRPPMLDRLEEVARETLDGGTDDPYTLPYALFHRYPALGILTARAQLDPARPFDSELVVQYIEEARVRLDLPPGDRGARAYEQLAEQHFEQVTLEAVAEDLTEQREELLEEVEQLRERLRRSTVESRSLEQAYGKATAQLAEVERQAAEATAADSEATQPDDADAGSAKAKEKLEELKALIAEGNQERAELRRELARLQEQLASQADGEEEDLGHDAAEGETEFARPEVAADAEAGSQILLPAFTKRAEEAIREAPQQLARAALVLAASLAAQEQDAWKGVKHLQTASGVFLVRPRYRYRLLFEVDAGRGQLLVTDLVHRKDLETAIKRYR